MLRIINPQMRNLDMWIIKRTLNSDPDILTPIIYDIGYYDPSGNFKCEFVEYKKDLAISLVSQLNGNSSFVYQNHIKEILEDMCAALEKIADSLNKGLS